MCSHSWKTWPVGVEFVLAGWLFMGGAASARAGGANALEGAVQELQAYQKLLQEHNISVEPETLKKGVVESLLKAADPYAAILSKADAERRLEERKGLFHGVGIKIQMKNKRPVILEVMKGGPAENSGLKEGDRLEKIGGRLVENLPLAEVVALMRGGRNEPVDIEVTAAGKSGEGKTNRLESAAGEIRTVTIVRGEIRMPAVAASEKWPKGIGHVKVGGLYEGSGGTIAGELIARLQTNSCGLILDLRGADGDDLSAVAEVAGLFAPSGTALFSVFDGQGTETKKYSVKEPALAGKPATPLKVALMVLTDKETLGAAEALAAVLGECKSVMLIGSPTAGDNRLREIIPLPDGRCLYIATARIELANGVRYGNAGLRPDVEVTGGHALTDIPDADKSDERLGPFGGLTDQDKAEHELMMRVNGDAVLQRAVDLLEGIKALDLQAR